MKFFLNRENNSGDGYLFVHLSAIGDLVISSLILRNDDLFENKIYFLIRKKYYPVLKDYEGRTRIITIKTTLYKWFIPYRFYFLNKLRSLNIAVAVNIGHNKNTISDEITLLSGAKKHYALSYETNRLVKIFKNLINNNYDIVFHKNEINEFEKIVILINTLSGKTPIKETSFFIKQSTISETDRLLSEKYQIIRDDKLLALAPFASNKFKMWPLKNFRNLMEKLYSIDNIKVVVLGDSTEKKNIDFLISGLSRSKFINVSGKFDLPGCASIIKRSNLFIGNDSGLLHIAKATKTPCIGIIGGGSYNIFHPYNNQGNDRILFHKMDCFGCEWKCIYDAPACLHEVNVNKVFDCVLGMLK